MEEVDLKTWEEFEERVEQLNSGRSARRGTTGDYISAYLFRGHSDSSWTLKTTLERIADRRFTLLEYYRVVALAAKPQVEVFTGMAWEIPTYADYKKELETSGLLSPGEFLAYEYFVYLRHHGFPSPLLDWTRSPYIAAYFAFRDLQSNASSVAIYAYCEYTVGRKISSSAKPGITGLGRYVRSHRRHFQQQSQYTICTIGDEESVSYAQHDEAFAGNREAQDELWKFNIPQSERRKVLERLEQYNINAFSLFGSEESLMETVSLREIYLGHGK